MCDAYVVYDGYRVYDVWVVFFAYDVMMCMKGMAYAVLYAYELYNVCKHVRCYCL